MFLVIIGLDLKLGYLVDQNVRANLVYKEDDMNKVKTSELCQVIIEKLSKVKGEKIRKQAIQICHILITNLEKAGLKMIEQKASLALLQFNYASLLLILTSLPDV